MRRFGKTLVTKILFWLTKFTLWRFHPEILAIAGSTNKTTVKNAIRAALPKTDSIRANPRSYNTEIGLPLAVLSVDGGGSSVFRWGAVVIRAVVTALGRQRFPKLLILELGVDRKGDMEYLLRMVQPQVLVLTNIADPSLVSEFTLALSMLPKDGYAIMNGDDVWVRYISRNAPCPVASFGVGSDNTFRICDMVEESDGVRAVITDMIHKTKTPVAIGRYGMHHLYAAAASIALKEWFERPV